MLLDETAKGLFIIAVTPFRDDGALDLESTDGLMDFYLARGVTGVTVLGIMGEAPKLSSSEAIAFVRRSLARIGGRVPVVVGVSAPGFVAMGELARAVMDMGAAGVMVAPPMGTRGDDGVVGYFEQVAEALGPIPFVLQDFPQTTNVHVSVAAIRRAVETLPTCVMLKHEDWPGLAKLASVRALTGRRISILAGNGGLFLPEEMRRGADGAMTGFAFPEMMTGVLDAHAAGDLDRAADVFDAYLPLARYEQQPGIGLAVRKHVLAQRGAIRSAAMRKPRAVPSAADLAEVAFLLRRQERRLADLGAQPAAKRAA